MAQKFFKNKYWTAYRASLSTFLQYRLNLVLYTVGHTITLTALYFLWRAIYHSGYALGEYTFEQILSYYFLIALLRLTINESTGMAFQVTNDIREGQVTAFLVKPFSYPINKYLDVLARTTLNISVVIPLVVVVNLVLGLSAYLPHGIAVFYGLAWCVLAIALYIVLYFLIASLSFWLDRAESYIYATIVMSNFFNGSLIPLDAFPTWFITLSDWLPFKYLMFLPIQAFLGRYTFDFPTIIIGLIWLLILSTAAGLTWRRGLTQYEGQGI